MGTGTRLFLGATLVTMGGLGVGLWAMREPPAEKHAIESTESVSPPEKLVGEARAPEPGPSAPIPRPGSATVSPRTEDMPRAPVPTPRAASFDELVRTYADLSPQQLDDMLSGIQSELDRRSLIQRANAEVLSDTEKEDFRLLLRRQNALYALKAQQLLKNSVQDSQ